MNANDCLLAFAELDQTYIAAANDTQKLRQDFMRQKKRRRRLRCAACGCAAVLLAAAAFGAGSRFLRTPSVLPAEPGAADRPPAEPASADAPSTASGVIPPQTQESSFEKAYRYSLNGPAYSDYIPGKVIEPDRVAEKIGDGAVTAGWEYADGATPATEQLRCEIYRITGIDPATAICIRFLDKGEALTTDHYYVQLNSLADLSAVEAYIIRQADVPGEE